MTSIIRLVFVALLLFASVGASAAARAEWAAQSVTVCKGAGGGADCQVEPIWSVNSLDGPVWVSAPVRLDGASAAPIGVFIKAFAASTIYWDGRLIGRNGRPGADAKSEVAGLRDLVVAIPSELARPGVHRIEIEMSTMRAPVRLSAPLIELKVAPFEGALQPPLRRYLPALATAGGMITVIAGLAFLAWRDRRSKTLPALIGAAACITLQLAVESSRAFTAMLYPVQIWRLEAVLIASCAFGVLLTFYFARRFNVGGRTALITAQASAMLFVILVPSGFDQKIASAILTSAGLAGLVAVAGVRVQASGGVAALVMLAACIGLGAVAPAAFVDRNLYFWALLVLIVLLAQEAWRFAYGRSDEQLQKSPATSLWLGSGRTRHLVDPGSIVRLAAADDYTEVFVAGSAPVLHPEPLHRLLGRLPRTFVRVHRSHAINLAYLESFQRGPNGNVRLSDQSSAPVSRRCAPGLIAAISA